MRNAISKLKSLWAKFSNREYRVAYLDETINSSLSAQIYNLRATRNLTQADVSKITGIAQPTLSRLESNADGVTTTTLKRIANAYDVALSVRFIPFGEFAEEVVTSIVDRPVHAFRPAATPKLLFAFSAVTASIQDVTIKTQGSTAGPAIPTSSLPITNAHKTNLETVHA